MMSTLMLLILYSFLSESSEIIACDQQAQCESQQLRCTDNEDCDILCSAKAACYKTKFICPLSPNSKCTFKCNAAQSAACQEATIYGQNSTLSIMITGYSYQYSSGFVNCPNNKQCNIQCGNNPSSDIQMCVSAVIDARYSTQLNITSYGLQSLWSSTIKCPNVGPCNITVIGNNGPLMSSAEIHIHDPHQTKLSLKCITDNIDNCYGTKGYVPMVYCYDDEYYCGYITNDGVNWHCQYPSPCDANNTISTILPTKPTTNPSTSPTIPTVNPTYSPTIPTTDPTVSPTKPTANTTHSPSTRLPTKGQDSNWIMLIFGIAIGTALAICIVGMMAYFKRRKQRNYEQFLATNTTLNASAYEVMNGR